MHMCLNVNSCTHTHTPLCACIHVHYITLSNTLNIAFSIHNAAQGVTNLSVKLSLALSLSLSHTQ